MKTVFTIIHDNGAWGDDWDQWTEEVWADETLCQLRVDFLNRNALERESFFMRDMVLFDSIDDVEVPLTKEVY